MYDPFEESLKKNNSIKNMGTSSNFPDFNTRFFPDFEEGAKSKTGKNLDKGTEIIKSAMNVYLFGLGLASLLIILPVLLRFLYEFSSWAFDKVGNIFP